MEAIGGRGILRFACLLAVLGCQAQDDVAENTRTTIQLVRSMEAYQQKMTKEFLMVAYGMNVSENRKHMEDTIGNFDVGLTNLENGDAAKGIIAPPNQGIRQELLEIKPKWFAYKGLLTRTYNTLLIWHKGFIASEASDPGLVQAILAFKQGWKSFAGTDAARRAGLQAAYITNNPYPTGNKDGLDFANGSEEYHQIHQDYHPKYRKILYERDYYDIFMFDLEGNLIYSVYKELDYATNFAAAGSGQWKDSGLGEAYEGALAQPDVITVIDWKPYGPSSGALASFLSTGIKQNGVMIGVFCTQLPPVARPKDPASILDLGVVERENTGLLASVQMLRDRYVSHAMFDDIELADKAQTFAQSQLLSVQQIMKEALFAILDVKRTEYLDAMSATEEKFDDLHNSLVWGDVVAGLPDLSKICTLHSMLEVGEEFRSLRRFLKFLRDTQAIAVSQGLVTNLVLSENLVKAAMEDAVTFFRIDDGKDPAVEVAKHRDYTATDAADPELADVIVAFTEAWNSFAANDAERLSGLQAAYITNNPHPTGSKDQLDFAVGSEEYHEVHKKYHPKYRSILYDRNYYDIFMLDLKGNLIYSVYKELDYATNFATDGNGEWKDSGLGEAYEAAVKKPDTITIIDWKPYGPSAGALASFLSTGIRNQNGTLVGVFSTQLPPDAKPVCSVLNTISAQSWNDVIAEVSNQRMLIQKATRMYLQIMKGVDVQASRIGFVLAVGDATSSLRKTLKGYDSIPAPPTQAVANVLLRAWNQWVQLEEEMKLSLDLNDDSFKTLTKIMDFNHAVDTDLDSAVEQYVLSAVAAKPMLRSATWAVSQRQTCLLQRMAVETLFLRFGIGVEVNAVSFKKSADAFETSHWELLKSREASAQTSGSFIPDTDLPETTDACTLDAMLDVMVKFSTVKESLQQVIVSNSTASEQAALHQANQLLATAADAMTTVMNFYKTGSGSCTLTRSTTMWEVALDGLSRLPYLLYKIEAEFALIESGLSGTWLNQAAADLANHKGFIAAEAGDPKLVDAFLAFKRGWDSFRPTDAERQLSLQVAYITLNEHPAGSKDQLDYAPGMEEYHVVHKQYHPIYRDILYARNYYDIFMLDLKGNLIYSVYKELDYATNFAPNGTIDERGVVQYGEWKDSGLGEAFEAAVQYPDVINVIDWKPYGPSNGALASFLSTGIKNRGKLIGVFCTQMPPESKPINSTEILEQTIQIVDDRIDDFKYGKTDEGIHPPATQVVADSLLDVSNLWAELELIVKGPQNPQSLAAVMSQSPSLSSSMNALEDVLVDGAWKGAPSLQGSKIVLASKQLALLQSMCRDSVLVAKNGLSVRKEDIDASMRSFEANHKLLREGGSVRRLAAKTDIAETTDPDALNLMKNVEDQWSELKPHLEKVTSQATEALLRSVVESTASAAGAMAAVAAYWGSTTRTTTMMSLEILAPIPLTGDWPAGQTLRLAAQLAEGLINQEQRILPGFKLKHVFLDDKCDPSRGSQIVLGEMSAKDTYIALGGAGCSKVCAQEASVASSIRLPFLSYECSSDFEPRLSDTSAYPDLTRMGTVTTPVTDVIKDVGAKWGWDHIIVLSGDRSKYKDLAEERKSNFEALGFTSEYKSTEGDDWKSIQTTMSDIRESTKGRNRTVFFIGTETLFRKVICASITEGLAKGIAWLTEGTWRHEWWTKTDQATPQQRQWLVEDVARAQLKKAFAEFKQAWDAYGPDVVTTRAALQTKYATDQKDALMSVDGPERYHDAHRNWHAVYRKILYDRGYYDIFFLDTSGDMIYSVYKESDYATNFKATGNGPWKDSGLGNAFEAAMARPDEVHYIDWKPYGPSGDAPAAFFATGLKDADGNLLGVYSIQLPPEFERSIEELQPQCDLQTIAGAFEGALNVAGLGRPTDENLEKPLDCFKSHSAKSLSTLIDDHLSKGYPADNSAANRVSDPYYDIKFHAVDATCAIAKTVEHLHKTKGYSIQQIQKPNDEVYAEFKRYMRNDLDFQGASGQVKFSNNNRPNLLAVKQVLQGKEVEVGLVHLNGTISWIGNGTSAAAWIAEPKDPPVKFAFWLVFQVGIPSIILCCACIMGIRVGLNRAGQNGGKSKEKGNQFGFEDSSATDPVPTKADEQPSTSNANVQEETRMESV